VHLQVGRAIFTNVFALIFATSKIARGNLIDIAAQSGARTRLGQPLRFSRYFFGPVAAQECTG
jgi:hypothetical protein